MSMFARIHPLDPRRGHKVERYVVGTVKFEVVKGWYRVSDRLAAILKKCLNDSNAPIPVYVFQVATEEEAKQLEKEDYERAHPERQISDAIKGAQTIPDSKLQLPEDEVPIDGIEEVTDKGDVEPLDIVDGDAGEPFGS